MRERMQRNYSYNFFKCFLFHAWRQPVVITRVVYVTYFYLVFFDLDIDMPLAIVAFYLSLHFVFAFPAPILGASAIATSADTAKLSAP